MRHLILATAALLSECAGSRPNCCPTTLYEYPVGGACHVKQLQGPAADKKLAGAAMNSFMKKCVSRMRQRLAILRRPPRNSPALQGELHQEIRG